MRGCNAGKRQFTTDPLVKPADEYRLDLLLQEDIDARTGKPRAGFETVERCLEEDGSRARGLTEIARALTNRDGDGATAQKLDQLQRLKLNAQAAADLSGRLQTGVETGQPEPTLGSSLF